MFSSKENHLGKDPLSKHSHIRRAWGSELQLGILGDTIQPMIPSNATFTCAASARAVGLPPHSGGPSELCIQVTGSTPRHAHRPTGEGLSPLPSACLAFRLHPGLRPTGLLAFPPQDTTLIPIP